MTQPQNDSSPMERQGELLQDLARVMLTSVDLTEQWQQLTVAFIPDGEAWAGRIVVTDADGSSSGGDARFGTDSQVSLLLDALQQAAADQRQPFVSLRLDAERTGEDRSRIALGSKLNYDTDPGSFDGLGGVDEQVARHMAERFGDDRLPAWVQEKLPRP
ncbi:hypothetical protein M4D54_02330 [Brachybacterium sp. p3-SID1565]|uniref:hypothetical protein n=1 Tax=unclassified Brachybacterium TaxID=2623841 RepID=UPI0021AA4C33|nr:MULTISPECIES: hypothetical protein [unclassified Brachybacterium]MCT1384474.1 hypothetical protein [Brachybacterium sp. p3-SID1565]MCT1775526.1 hypothetical protein [Brachybacterium sp. p3-SID957]